MAGRQQLVRERSDNESCNRKVGTSTVRERCQLLASRRQTARVNSIGEHMQILLSAVISGERKMLGAPLQRVR